MFKFHQIPTDKFIPISHDNSYLFNHYEKISNFLQFDFDVKYKNVLAKPVKNDGSFEFYSVYEDVSIVSENQKNTSVLIDYWKFIDAINIKIDSLYKSDKENNKNWASLLSKTFNDKDNLIFSNGSNFCIVWGWAFNSRYERFVENTIVLESDNSNIQEPKLVDSINNDTSNIHLENDDDNQDKKEIFDEEDNFLENNTLEIDQTNYPKESNFIKFLKWISSKFWWILWIILLIIIFMLLLKSCRQDKEFNDLNSKLMKLEQKANNCCD